MLRVRASGGLLLTSTAPTVVRSRATHHMCAANTTDRFQVQNRFRTKPHGLLSGPKPQKARCQENQWVLVVTGDQPVRTPVHSLTSSTALLSYHRQTPHLRSRCGPCLLTIRITSSLLLNTRDAPMLCGACFMHSVCLGSCPLSETACDLSRGTCLL